MHPQSRQPADDPTVGQFIEQPASPSASSMDSPRCGVRGGALPPPKASSRRTRMGTTDRRSAARSLGRASVAVTFGSEVWMDRLTYASSPSSILHHPSSIIHRGTEHREGEGRIGSHHVCVAFHPSVVSLLLRLQHASLRYPISHRGDSFGGMQVFFLLGAFDERNYEVPGSWRGWCRRSGSGLDGKQGGDQVPVPWGHGLGPHPKARPETRRAIVSAP